MKLYHGGVPGLSPGDAIVPAAPHVTDGCPVCVARASGRACTVAEMRAWAMTLGPHARPLLAHLAEAPDDAIVDGPRAEKGSVYVTSDLGYARWYAARSRGDLYAVTADGLRPSATDPFPAWTAPAAVVVGVIERRVRLDRRDRRELNRRWRRADERAGRVSA